MDDAIALTIEVVEGDGCSGLGPGPAPDDDGAGADPSVRVSDDSGALFGQVNCAASRGRRTGSHGWLVGLALVGIGGLVRRRRTTG